MQRNTICTEDKILMDVKLHVWIFGMRIEGMMLLRSVRSFTWPLRM